MMLTALIIPPLFGAERYFSVSKVAPYSFITPLGKPFWSLGVCCTDRGTDTAKYDSANPSYSSEKLFANKNAWVHDTLGKLKKWNFNSLGGWSDHATISPIAGSDRIPYFLVLHLGAYDMAPWHDLFAPQMRDAVDKAARDQIEKVAKDTMLVGYFSDNELGWWDDTLLASYWKMPVGSPGKSRLLSVFRRHYANDISRIKLDWITTAKSFDEFAAESSVKVRTGGNAGQMLNAWTFEMGSFYYKLMHDTIRKYDRNHLILGDRYCQYFTLPIVKAAAPYVDVISTNFGSEWNDGQPSHFFLDTLHRASGKPVVITEFYMCAMENRSGNKNSSGGFPIVQTQFQRANSFKRYVTTVASLPYVVGAHWFQFYDEPMKGRGDGENYNMGLVDTAGVPYEELTSAAASLNISALRKTSKAATANGKIPPANAEPMSGLLDWPRTKSLIAPLDGLPTADLYATWKSDAIYLGLFAMDYIDESIYVGNRIPEIERSCWKLKLSGRAKPIEVRFGGKNRKATCSDSAIEVFEKPDLKHTLILRVPGRYKIGDSVRVESALTTHSQKAATNWSARLTLSR